MVALTLLNLTSSRMARFLPTQRFFDEDAFRNDHFLLCLSCSYSSSCNLIKVENMWSLSSLGRISSKMFRVCGRDRGMNALGSSWGTKSKADLGNGDEYERPFPLRMGTDSRGVALGSHVGVSARNAAISSSSARALVMGGLSAPSTAWHGKG